MRFITLIIAALLIFFAVSNYVKSRKNDLQESTERVDTTITKDPLINYTKKSVTKIRDEADSRMKDAEKVLIKQ